MSGSTDAPSPQPHAESPAAPLRIFAATSYGPHTALTGGRLRRDNLLQALAARGHSVDRLDVPGAPGIASAANAGRLSLTAAFRERARAADVVLLGDVFVLPMMPVLARTGRPVLVELVDSPYRLVGAAPKRTPAERASALFQAAQLVPVMQVLLPMADAVTYISDEDGEVDRAHVKRLPPDSVVPNGIESSLLDLPLTTPPDEGYLAWLADWRYPPNRESYEWFVEEVAVHLPDDVLARVRTFGAGDPSTIRGTGDACWDRVRTLVQHAGFVDSLAQVYEEARATVAPVVRGAGVNNKVLEPLAAGRGVLTTAIGSRGLPPEIRAHLRIASTGAEFAAQVEDLLRSPGSAAEAQQARAAVQALSWDAAAVMMEEALRRVVAASGSRSAG
ncbi:Glycosyltransferase involved in cell wall bisynthesis [Geodermatophilus amargosae]|uniref:Glycosyltransferase involved in cell wall bisynthesis n=1 Tax=Geodermatophilus amargosae TaxID=1296565 RepID=A0A1I6XX89_9ACTN|nr:glycosyltransferase [Geodermatophilus amargosae]SFT42930.1 Glycosyltransferase involved in cell wall bisynthesis [Geodermatophilus amargosae]